MSTLFSGVTGYGALFVVTLLSGVLLSHSGNPYNSFIFTIHKLVAVATVILIGRYVYRLNQSVEVNPFVAPGALLITGLLFVALIISGALLSLQDGALLNLQRPLLQAIHAIHQLTPMLALLSTGLTVYLLAAVRT